MRAGPLSFLIVVAGLLSTAPTLAQEHAAASGVMISHDGPADGTVFVGQWAHFGVLDLGGDEVPDFHQQNHIRVTLDGVVVFETTPDTGHDYDGVNTFDVRFPHTGDYEVAALGDHGVIASFTGHVVDVPESELQPVLDGPDTLTAGTLATYTLTLDGHDHSDALWEVRQDDSLVLRFKTHAHAQTQSAALALPTAGSYQLRVTTYQASAGGDATFAPITIARDLDVQPGADPAPATPTTPPADMNTVVETGDGAYRLVGTYDPYTQVGTATQQHLNVLVMDPAVDMPVQHVDFTATLTGPLGVVWSSDSLHEYDGILETTAVGTVPGQYRLDAHAERDGWSADISLPYTVVPPAEPAGVGVPPSPAAGPSTITATGLDALTAGVPANVILSVADAAGNPRIHSEVDVLVVDAAGVPVLATKLHTHGTGDFPFAFAVPDAGDYTLVLSPFPLGPETTLPSATALSIHAGPGPVPMAPDVDIGDGQATPIAPLLPILAVVVAYLARRR